MSATIDPATDTFVSAEAALVAVPLPRPIRVRGAVLTEREYVVLRLRTASGLEGAAIGYTRGLPLLDAVERLMRELIELAGAAPPQRGPEAGRADVRARSLVELARWDVEARRAGLPLGRLLGGDRATVPVLGVGGYFLDERTADDVVREFLELADGGFRHLKLHADDPDLVARVARSLPAGVSLAVDLQMRYRTLEQALAACRGLEGLGLAFVEDPFPPELPGLTKALAKQVRTPVAAGEDAEDPAALVALAAAADVVRVDATASGGIAAVEDALRVTRGAAKPVITHAFVELHAQIAGGLAGIGLVETIPYSSGANPVARILAETQPVRNGEIVLSERPGNGLSFDWDAVAHHTRETRSHHIERRD